MSKDKKRAEVITLPSETLAQLRERRITALTIQEADRVWVKNPYRFGTSFVKDMNDVIGGGEIIPIDDIEPSPDDQFSDYLRRLYFDTDVVAGFLPLEGVVDTIVAWHLGAGVMNPLVTEGRVHILDTIALDHEEEPNGTINLLDQFAKAYSDRECIKSEDIQPSWPAQVHALFHSFIYFQTEREDAVRFVSPFKHEVVSLFQPRQHWTHGLDTPLIYWIRNQAIEDFDALPSVIGQGDLIVVSETYEVSDFMQMPSDHPIWKWHSRRLYNPNNNTMLVIPDLPSQPGWRLISTASELALAQKVALIVPDDPNTFTGGRGIVGATASAFIESDWHKNNLGLIEFDQEPQQGTGLLMSLIDDSVLTIDTEINQAMHLAVSPMGIMNLSSSTNVDWRAGKLNEEFYSLANENVTPTTARLGWSDDQQHYCLVTNANPSVWCRLVGYFS